MPANTLRVSRFLMALHHIPLRLRITMVYVVGQARATHRVKVFTCLLYLHYRWWNWRKEQDKWTKLGMYFKMIAKKKAKTVVALTMLQQKIATKHHTVFNLSRLVLVRKLSHFQRHGSNINSFPSYYLDLPKLISIMSLLLWSARFV